MPIIEVMTTRSTAEAPALFTVDNTEQTVPMVKETGTRSGLMFSALNGSTPVNTDSWFEIGDNFNLLSIGYTLPLSFKATSGFNGGSLLNAFFDVKLIGIDNDLNSFTFYDGYIPFSSYELAIGQYMDVVSAGFTSKWELFLQMGINAGTPTGIDMTNVPDDLNAQVFPVLNFIKLQHNSPTTTTP